MARGYWMPVLHAHLPFVRHPEYNDSLEERWLYEAITETYLPLLQVFDRLVAEKVDFRITMSVTPPLANMLDDPLLQERSFRYLNGLIELTEKEIFRTNYLPEFNRTAKHYHQKLLSCKELYEGKLKGNVLNGFRYYMERGNLEIITCGATHGFLPLMNMYPNAVRAQIETAVHDYERIFGQKPKGMWNGECGFYPGLEKLLGEGGIKYFFVDTHGILHADTRPKYGVFAPMATPNGVAFFGRDVETSNSVWSSEQGYPGDPVYREFYRDVGFDLEYDYIKPYIHESGLRVATGIKYHRITDKHLPQEQKAPYDPKAAFEKTREHGYNFTFNREQQVSYLNEQMDRVPLVVSMYDAELFGHWWYEGPDFIYHTLKAMFESEVMNTITPSEYLSEYPLSQKATPPMCSWGYMGYNQFWLDQSNDWIYKHLHSAANRMIQLANQFKDTEDRIEIRALNQASRELLLAQSSDWAFIMRTGTMVDYANKRTVDHVGRFNRLYDMLVEGPMDEAWLMAVEDRDNIFPEMDFHVYTDTDED